ncbi:hypothetical protein J2W49_001927 [Hydrogenophaga palleronii]|uniref:Uncharacterized protein n=1 Tax=Hydrogenophaga palleronii TaxID=65655 RepID=A0ABU1WM22_9BURK|nr:hypothetical protein [Hydrogenophaga palleronii]MDR7149972.1 hypothetical protein [Hydrogenophaga palleronii]
MSAATREAEQELEASGAVLSLLHEAATWLGASPAQAAEAARTGVIELESRSIAVAPTPDEDVLVLSTALPADWFDTPERRTAALRACTALLLQAGVAYGRTLTGPALMCRWSLAMADAGLFAGWLRQFAAMANMLVAGAGEATASVPSKGAA